MCKLVLAAVLAVFVASASCAAIVVPGAEGYDGPFNPTGTSYVVDLAQAVTGSWDDPPAVAGNGVYDPVKWAVVFKYSSVNIPAGCTVTFNNHPSKAPVVWLVSGDVVINGTVSVSGKNTVGGSASAFTEAGPGGFRGGAGWISDGSGYSPGFGWGGGNKVHNSGWGPNASAGHATPGSGGTTGDIGGRTYGNGLLLPLIGGSGGAGKWENRDLRNGGGGGGAILIASQGLATISGRIYAYGGSGASADPVSSGGSGGSIRVVCDTLNCGSQSNLNAIGSDRGGDGRIRLERNLDQSSLSAVRAPLPSVGAVGQTAVLWPPDTAPTLTVKSLGQSPVPADPVSDLGLADVSFTAKGLKRIVLEGRNFPTDWTVEVRAASRGAEAQFVALSNTGGDQSLSTWEGDINLPEGFTAIQARASKP